jgi:ArsR family transcriptional regulator, virulence genes transcriptional regulator
MPRPRPARLPDLDRIAEMHAHSADAAQLMKALGNEQRLLILCNLVERPLSVSEINERVQLSQSALSQHLALLREQGMVETRREAQSIYYSLPPGAVTRIMAVLQEIFCSTPSSRGKASSTRRSSTARRSAC